MKISITVKCCKSSDYCCCNQTGSPLVLIKIGPRTQDFFVFFRDMYLIFDNIFSTLPNGEDSAV